MKDRIRITVASGRRGSFPLKHCLIAACGLSGLGRTLCKNVRLGDYVCLEWGSEDGAAGVPDAVTLEKVTALEYVDSEVVAARADEVADG